MKKTTAGGGWKRSNNLRSGINNEDHYVSTPVLPHGGCAGGAAARPAARGGAVAAVMTPTIARQILAWYDAAHAIAAGQRDRTAADDLPAVDVPGQLLLFTR